MTTFYKTIKRLKLSDITPISRAKKGNMLFKKAKTKDYKILFAYLTETKDVNLYKIDTDIHELKNSDIPIMDIASTGSQVKFNYDLFALKKELVDLTKTTTEETKEVEGLVVDFVNAAVRAKKSGADGVELHGAHGYLIAQFLSSHTNKRTDKYGGSLENRTRFLTEIIMGIKDACGTDYPISVRKI